MGELLLGLDLGTTSAKAAAYDLSGRLHAESSAAYPTYFPRPGWAEQRPSDWTRALTAAVQGVVAQLGNCVDELAGAALAAQGPGLVLLTERGERLAEMSPTWQDERCAPQGRWLYDRVETLWPGLGGPFTNFPAKLRWAQEHQATAAARARFAMGIKDYLLYWLTGEVVTEPTSGSGGPAWNVAVFAACGWSVDRLPKILQPTDTVGPMLASVAGAMGLPQRLPLIAGLNDGASATLATGALSLGDAIVTLATNGVLRFVMDSAVSSDLRLDHHLFNWPYLPPDRWIAGGQTKAGARALQWFAEAVGGPNGADVDGLLREAEASEAGSRGAIFLPYLMGRGSPQGDATATGIFAGLTLATTRGDLTRAVLEGVAFALRDIQEDFARFGHPPRALRLSGGGGRSRLWRQIIADVLGEPLTYFAGDSTLGAAMVASIGLGLHTDWQSAAGAMVNPVAQHEPVATSIERYRDGYAGFGQKRDALFPPGTADVRSKARS